MTIGHTTTDPVAGGGIWMGFETVPAENCASLVKTPSPKLPLSAANSMNYVASCLGHESWIAQNYELRNILNPTCTWGYDEICSLNMSVSNQPICPHQLGVPVTLTASR
ncbi:hypothetical protein V8F33_013536 [Rhypophila sp. PSN 637]